MAVAVLLLTWSIACLVQPEVGKRTMASLMDLRVPAGLVLFALAWAGLQLSGWTPAGWTGQVSIAPESGFGQARAIAIIRDDALVGIMLLLAYVGVFALAATLCGGTSEARFILATIALSAALITLYAMVADVVNRQAVASGVVIWVPRLNYFTGTFVNPNNYATYAGIAALAAFVLAFAPPRPVDSRETARQRWRRRLGQLSGHGGLWFAVTVILLVGVLMSGSRGAWISVATAFTVLGMLYARGVSRAVFGALLPLAFGVATVLLPGGDRLVTRALRLVAEGDVGRETVFPVTMQAIGLRPLIGWGMNSFESLYPMFQPPSSADVFDKAHNTYLELAFDFGIPAAAMIVLAVTWIAVRCMIGFFTRRRDRELAALGVLVCVLGGIHSLVDFSLQIPADACVFFAVLGVSWAQSWSSRREA